MVPPIGVTRSQTRIFQFWTVLPSGQPCLLCPRRVTYPKVHTRMQSIFARNFALRSPRFDSETGKRRGFWYSWRALAAGLVLALAAGSGIAVVAVASNADAHVPSTNVTCSTLHVLATWYVASGTNTVEVKIDDVVKTAAPGPETFATTFDQTYNFDPTVAHTYSVVIAAFDWRTFTSTGTTTPCLPPSLSIDIPVCSSVGGTVDFAAVLGNLDASHSYSIALSSPDAGATSIPPTDFTPGSFPAYNYPFTGIVPGHSYTVTVLDKTVNLPASATKQSVGCPHDTGITIVGTECMVAGGSGTLTASVSGLSIGRTYTVTAYDGNNVQIGTESHLTADASGVASVSFSVPPGGTYKAVIVDDAAPSKTSTSPTYSFLPCPHVFAKPTIFIDPCTSTSPPSNAFITYLATGLVPGRQYTLTVTDDATNANLVPPVTFTAASSTYPTNGVPAEINPVNPGNYTVTVTDVLVPSFTQAEKAVVILCPLMPNLAFTPTQCTVPGGTASIVTTVTNFIPGRDYRIGVTLVQGGVVVAPTLVTAPQNGPWVLPPFSTLPPGTGYRISVTDSVVPTVSAFGDISLKVCPGMPGITVQASCNVLGASTATVSLDKLEAGETYTVNIVNASSNKVLGTTTVAGTTPTATAQLKNIPNGNSYTVTIANATNTLTGSASFFLKKCDLPTLAFTGANPIGPGVTGIGFLQLGLAFVGFALVRRRRVA